MPERPLHQLAIYLPQGDLPFTLLRPPPSGAGPAGNIWNNIDRDGGALYNPTGSW